MEISRQERDNLGRYKRLRSNVLEKLQAVYDVRRTNKQSLAGDILDEAGTKVPGYMGMYRPKITPDGYEWFWALEFKPPDGGSIVVCFPWGETGSNGILQPDRPLAAFVLGTNLSEEDLTCVLAKLAKELERVP